MEKSLAMVMKNASTAIYLDSENRLIEAYVQYLQCLSSISYELLHNASQLGNNLVVSKPVRKYVQLGQQCMERIGIILDRLGQNPSESRRHSSASSIIPHAQVKPADDVKITLSSVPPSPGDAGSSYRKPQGMSPMEMAYRHNQQLLNAYRSRTARMNHAAASNLSLTVQRKMAENLAIAKTREEALRKKMKERQQRLEEQASRNLSSVQQCASGGKPGRTRKTTMARRFSVPTGMSKKEQEQRQTYKKILEYEQDEKWLVDWRSRLEQNPKDASLIHQLICEILRCEDHPLSQLLKHSQYKLYQKLATLVEQKMEKINEVKVQIDDSVKYVPKISELLSPVTKNDKSHPLSTSKQDKKDSEVNTSVGQPEDLNSTGETISVEVTADRNQGERNSDEENGEVTLDQNNSGYRAVQINPEVETNWEEIDDHVDSDHSETLHQVHEEVKSDVERAIEIGKDLTNDLKHEKRKLTKMASECVEKTVEDYENEISEEIWGSDEENTGQTRTPPLSMVGENVDDDSRVCRSESIGSSDSADSNTQRWRSLYSESVKPEDKEKIEALKNEAYARHLKWIAMDVHSYMEELLVMFIVAYEQLDSPEGRDQCYASLEEPFFKPVWGYLLALFRLANLPKERALADIMSCYHTATPQDVGVRPKLCLVLPPGETDENYLPYKPAIVELQTVSNSFSPLAKLECLVRVSRCVCQCVEEYYSSTVIGSDKASKQPNIGADDLLPILTYVIIRSKVCQVVSECQAMEEFIHEGYLMGEEGYCLTSLQTAVNYILSLHQRYLKTETG